MNSRGGATPMQAKWIKLDLSKTIKRYQNYYLQTPVTNRILHVKRLKVLMRMFCQYEGLLKDHEGLFCSAMLGLYMSYHILGICCFIILYQIHKLD